ncbi:hypothetical protein FACS1894186_5780 [Alphaproteobacteria bacterium]|nr:hypothetical protein FACS1894186_5780 [Alphaproteobacteria bacterium]
MVNHYHLHDQELARELAAAEADRRWLTTHEEAPPPTLDELKEKAKYDSTDFSGDDDDYDDYEGYRIVVGGRGEL